MQQQYKVVDKWDHAKNLYLQLGQVMADLQNEKRQQIGNFKSYIPKANEDVIIVFVHASENQIVDWRGKRVHCTNVGRSQHEGFIQMTFINESGQQFGFRSCVVSPTMTIDDSRPFLEL